MTSAASAFSTPVEPPPEGTPWTILHLVRWSAGYLSGKGVENGRLDAEHLLAHVLETDRLQLYLRFEQPVAPEELARFRPLLLDRARRKPLQYVLGRAAFREMDLKVDPRVLIPRPETEELVQAVLDAVGPHGRDGLTAVDVGTGSGAIALSLAREGPFRRVVGIEASSEALDVARENAREQALEDRVEFRLGSGLRPVPGGETFDVLVSNPPYVAETDFAGLQAEVRLWEPQKALVAGADGLAVIREILDGAPRVLDDGGLLALEVGAGQAEVVARELGALGGFGEPTVLRDVGGLERLVLATRRGADG